jgi:threonylcarbamoyladenosine tRNA methylthiotransferase MtaB
VALRTLGCRANQYDTELMKERLRGEFELVSPGEEADVYIVNTCTVTAKAEAKARQYIRSYARRGLVLVTGCWATIAPEEVGRIEGASLIFSNEAKPQVRELIIAGRQGVVHPSPDGNRLDEERISLDSAHTRAFVKIQDGCDQFCTFCRTIQARGPSRSKSPQAVLAEVQDLAKNGFAEVVLTGINLADYGQTAEALPHLLWKLEELPELKRIRLSSFNPQGVTAELVEFFRRGDKGCPYFHLALQSGDDGILHSMNRGYSVDEYKRKVELIREEVPGATFGADILVGFPGEGEQEFQRTCQLIEELGLLRLHIFRYSPRPGTPAAHFPGQVSEEVKLDRAEQLRKLAKRLSRRVRQAYLNQRLQVLIEERAADGRYRGWSENYLDVHVDRPGRELHPGEIVEVEAGQLFADHLRGRLSEEVVK